MKMLCLLLATVFSLNAHAATRCVNAAGAVVGYADTAASCPAGSSFKGEVAPMPAAAASDVKNAQAQAARDQKAVDTLEAQRVKDERADAKAQLAAQTKNSGKAKSCKHAELALKNAKGAFDDTAYDRTVGFVIKKSKSNNNKIIHEDNSNKAKKRRKAQRSLDLAQGKRDLACG